MPLRHLLILTTALTSLTTTTCSPPTSPPSPRFSYPLDDTLRLHHVQVKGTHNSYHLEPTPPLHPSHRYSQLPLDEQLETQGVRAFEIDLHFEAAHQRLSVFHIGVFDKETTCATFSECVQLLQSWSDHHRDHLPILVWLEIKSGTDGLEEAALTLIEQTITDLVPSPRLLTPALVQGEHGSLQAALQEEGWPTLGALRGRIGFILLNGGPLTSAYLSLHPQAQGGTLFPSVNPSEFSLPWAAFAKLNSPSGPKIADAISKRILVASNICMADETDQTCHQKREAGLANGVTMLKDDFPGPVETRSYWLEFPDGDGPRCNPQTAPPECTSSALEHLQ